MKKIFRVMIKILCVAMLFSLVFLQEYSAQAKKNKKELYKKSCKTIYYEKIDDGKVKEGMKVKIRIYVEGNRQFDVMDMYSGIVYEKKLKSSFIVFGAKLKKYKNNYGGENILYFKQGSKLKPEKYRSGQYITIYGEVIERKINGWTGHGSIGVLAKYIEKGKK